MKFTCVWYSSHTVVCHTIATSIRIAFQQLARMLVAAGIGLSGISQVHAAVDLSSFDLVFDEEFDGTELDPNRWNTGYSWGPYQVINAEQQLYVDTLGMHKSPQYDPFELTGDTLKIKAKRVENRSEIPEQPGIDSSEWGQYQKYRHNPDFNMDDVEFLSGAITSYESFNFTHGYAETRVKLPKGQGLWPAFWLNTSWYVGDVPEIDVMEFLGHDPSTIYHTYHYFDIENNWSKVSTPSLTSIADDWTNDFHTFGVAWGPTEIIWYVDGVKAHTVDRSYKVDSKSIQLPKQSMYLLANLATGGSWPGDTDSSTADINVMEIDYIKVYQKSVVEDVDTAVLESDYQLMFSDEFDSTELNPDKWTSALPWGPYLPINNEKQFYVDALGMHKSAAHSPFSINEGVLSIQAEPSPESFHQNQPDPSDLVWQEFKNYYQNPDFETKPYTSGVLTTRNSFNFVNGYSEIRARLPVGNGLWPAFWQLNSYYVGPQPQIDILEARGEDANVIEHNYSYRNSAGELVSLNPSLNTFDAGGLAGQWHTYGVSWDKGRIAWYVDGIQRHTLQSENVSVQMMYAILNLAVGGNFSTIDIDEGALPASLEIDYIRIYQRKNELPSDNVVVGPVDTGGEPAGSTTSGESSSGTDTAGTDTSGTDTAGTDTAGTDTAGTDTSGTTTTGTTTSGDTATGDETGSQNENFTLYENAEDGSTLRWAIVDNNPAGAKISNEVDTSLSSRVIRMTGQGTGNAFRAGGKSASDGWSNEDQFILSWKLKSAGIYVINVHVQTTAGSRVIRYKPSTSQSAVTLPYLNYELGASTGDGEWYSHSRDLAQEVAAAEPGNTLLAVYGFQIRGNVSLDELMLSGEEGAGGSSTSGSDSTGSASDGVTSTDASGTATSGSADGTDTGASSAGGTDSGTGTSGTTTSGSDTSDTTSSGDTTAGGVTGSQSGAFTLYEDAEDGSTSRWAIVDNDPAGAQISNEVDTSLSSRVIRMTGQGTGNAFRAGGKSASDGWNNEDQFTLSWKMKSAGIYVINVHVQTTAGSRVIRYKPSTTQSAVTLPYLNYELGASTGDGEWYSHSRDLAQEVAAAEPGNTLLAVHGFQIRGNVSLDELMLSGEEGAGGSSTSGSDSTGSASDGGTSTDASGTATSGSADGTDTGASSAGGTDSGTGTSGTTTSGSDTSGTTSSGDTTAGGITGSQTSAFTLYEDAEDGSTLRWNIVDNDPLGAQISNEVDASLGSRVIRLAGQGTGNAFRAGGKSVSDGWNNEDQFTLSWKMKSAGIYVINIQVETTDGSRVIRYKPSTSQSAVTLPYLNYELGASTGDGEWYSHSRNLEQEVAAAEPGNTLLAVHGFQIRGNVSLDELMLSGEEGAGASSPSGSDSTGSATDGGTSSNASGTATSGSADGTYAGASSAGGTDSGTGSSGTTTSGDTTAGGVTGSQSGAFTLYEDAEDGSTLRWNIVDNDPVGAQISNEVDASLSSRVIRLAGQGTGNAFRAGGKSASDGWNNEDQFTLSWKMKSAGIYVINIQVETTDGSRVLRYKPSTSQSAVTLPYLNYELGASTGDGEWYSHSRNLAQEVAAAEPGNSLLAVHGFQIRGNVSLDELSLSSQ